MHPTKSFTLMTLRQFKYLADASPSGLISDNFHDPTTKKTLSNLLITKFVKLKTANYQNQQYKALYGSVSICKLQKMQLNIFYPPFINFLHNCLALFHICKLN